ncbi:hypothetical protein LCGC14_2375670 [marine sediment metagenome]|uniref:Uncharacterized protein n=1 Tax=marine sediment metagenome TaxID=412755 RepID=A0A0F9C2J5_9ZZZZ
MDNKALSNLIGQEPRYGAILAKALAFEQANVSAEGWAWHGVDAYPAQLSKLVVLGIIRIAQKGPPRSCTLYRLTNAVQTRRFLDGEDL